MARKSESLLQMRIQQRLRQQFPHAYVRKIHGNEFQHSGIPDLLCCIQGMFIGIEVKHSGIAVTKIQENEGNEIILACGIWIVGESPDQVAKEVQGYVDRRNGLV